MADDPAAPAEPVAADLPFRAVALSVIVGSATVLGLWYAEALLVPLLLAILLAYALDPLVSGLGRLRVPRPVAAVLVFGLALAGVHASERLAVARLNGFLAQIPTMVSTIKDAIGSTHSASPAIVADLRRTASELAQATAAVGGGTPSTATPVTIVRPPFDLVSVLLDNGVTMAEAAAYAIAVALLTFLLLATGDVYKKKLMKLGGATLESRKITFDVMKAIDRQIERYLLVRVLISAIVAAFTAAVLWIVGLRHWFGWGITAGVLNVVPFIGPTAAVGLIALAAFLQAKSAALVGAAAGLSGLVAMIEGNFLTPWLTSRAGELNTVAVFVGVLFWGWLWGVWGLVLAVPILVVVKAVAEHIEQLRPVAELLGR